MIRDTLEHMADSWQKLGQRRTTFEMFVLEYGKTFGAVEVGKRGEKKECFRNAAKLVLDSPSLIYVEGYCAHKEFGLPLLHAWVESVYTGAALEVTFDDPENFEYFGIRYQSEFLRRQTLKHKTWGLLGGHPSTAHDLLTGAIPQEEWKL